MALTSALIPFASWADLLDHVKAGYRLFYQAPMDYRAVHINAVIRKDGTVRVLPCLSDADPFNADQGHLDRFRHYADKRTINQS